MGNTNTDKEKDLEKQFDDLYKEMQTPEARAAFDVLLNANPEQLTQAARKSVNEKNTKD